ncbi:MAG TPA: vanadium-dependent haloperoxidase, partial [Chitinophagaceae bacterium]|nr:vanadium-dependent haloperoxidase [Chitinophagaceae bacterium]
MNTSINRSWLANKLMPVIIVASLLLFSCKKNDSPHHPSSYPSTVLDKWITMQLRLMRNATGIANQAFSRHFAYSGITAIEAMAPGLEGRRFLTDKWNGLSGLPFADRSKNYYYPASVNAAMASINRLMFPNASVVDKAAIDSLENALKAEFNKPASLITVSSDFGKAVAQAVFNWSETDGYKNASAPYTPPVGVGIWTPTPPNNAAASTPYWGNNRPIVIGSTNNAQPPAPPAYSTDPASPFYQMVKEVYDVSTTLTDDQKAMAIFWRDVPGVSSPGHWLSILQQLLKQKNASLDELAVAYALAGSALNDALIVCFKAKYQYMVVRPITYIRGVMEQTSWTPYLVNTPPHPEYASAHSALSMAAAKVLEKLVGNVSNFTDHTYDYMGLAPRTYSSLSAIAEEAGKS